MSTQFEITVTTNRDPKFVFQFSGTIHEREELTLSMLRAIRQGLWDHGFEVDAGVIRSMSEPL